ncbi:hypothetical protein ACFQX6_24160 [Streptosporangium lutulentum]
MSRLEDAIWALQPTASNLDEVARRAQEALGIECSDAISGLCSATREAADRVFDDLYSDENAYRAIEFVLPALTFFNPREIKRYVNVFRFYSFLTYRRTLAGAAPASDGEVAKLAALTIHWPHLLSLLVKEVGRRPCWRSSNAPRARRRPDLGADRPRDGPGRSGRSGRRPPGRPA